MVEVYKEVVCTCGDCEHNYIVRCNARQIWINEKGKCKAYKKKKEEKKDEQV